MSPKSILTEIGKLEAVRAAGLPDLNLLLIAALVIVGGARDPPPVHRAWSSGRRG